MLFLVFEMDFKKRNCITSLSSERIPFTLKKSNKAKRMRLQIGIDSGLEVVIPSKPVISLNQVERFVFEKQKWVLKNLERMERIRRKAALKHSVLFLGREIPIELIESSKKTSRAVLVNERLIVRIPIGKKSLVGRAIHGFYKKQARQIIPGIVREKSREMRACFKRVSIRDQKTRWGSCSLKGTLSFNWRLIAAPRSIIEYLVVHELVHLKHRNHSKAFWRDVEAYCPDYKQAEKWLRENKHFLRARTSFL